MNQYKNALDALTLDSNFRKRRKIEQCGKFVFLDGKKLLNLSSNDYLGISIDNNIRDNFLKNYTGKIQNPSARLLSGSNKVFFELEDLIAQKLNKEGTLLFNSGYHANVGIYSSLLKKGDVVFIDKLNHASIIDGVKLSGAKIVPFAHADYDDLERKLDKYRKGGKNSIISTESLFSMDGDFADIKKLCALKEKYNSLLIVDEAHSFGVYGNGAGYAYEKGVVSSVDLIMGTFGKAVGSYGAFAAGSKVLIDYLTNFARSFIFSTALPEISVAFSKYVLENYIFSSNSLQKTLLDISKYAGEKINPESKSYIIPFLAGRNEDADLLSKRLINQGFYALPIKYPTVKKGSARIRISLNPAISKQEIDRLAQVLNLEFAEKL